jgi:hypothetical protein
MAQYVMLAIISLLTMGLTAYLATVHSIQVARATMSRYVQIALQQVADAAVTVDPATGGQWTKTTAATAPAAVLFQQDLRGVMAGTPWAAMPVAVVAFHIYTPQDVGAPAPWGYPGSTISAPGYYAEVTFPWRVTGWLPAVTITVPEVMQANVDAQPGSGPPAWNPGAP